MRGWQRVSVVLAGVTLVSCTATPRRGSGLTARPTPAPAPAPTPVAPSPAPAPPPTDLASVNWREHTYVIDGQRYQLRRGEWEMHEYLEDWGGAHDTELYRFESVTLADLDGDGADEAVVLLWHMYAGPGGPHSESVYLVSFGWRDGAPAQLDVTGAGNVRIRSVVVAPGGQVTVVHERAVPPFMTTRWRWTAGKLTPTK
ncbi:MAG: hypothetical protein IT370_20690 [Deltaproteobacteria bacterium]|nr:hypothetical protein [Deltaproteobacteria bacterium]